MSHPCIYLLHSGQLFGTERMALATLQHLGTGDAGVVMAPPGPLHAVVRELGLRSVELRGAADLPRALFGAMRRAPDSTLFATSVTQSLWASALAPLTGHRGAHLHVVHGGTDERLSYGRKSRLLPLPVHFVAVSPFVRSRLVAHGVPAGRISVVANFLAGPAPACRGPFGTDGVRRVAVLSRLDPIKRVGLLFDALDRVAGLDGLRFDIYGSGADEAVLRARAARHPNVTMHGFVPDAASALAEADLLLHTCPEEPFGLVLLEAFAAGVPVLVPNAGGAAGIVRAGLNGWHFTANDAVALGQALRRLAAMPAAQLDAAVQAGRESLQREFDPRRQARRYAELAAEKARGGAQRVAA